MNLFIINLYICYIFSYRSFCYYITIPSTQRICLSNPDNIDKILFQDHVDNCFKFSSKENVLPMKKKIIRHSVINFIIQLYMYIRRLIYSDFGSIVMSIILGLVATLFKKFVR